MFLMQRLEIGLLQILQKKIIIQYQGDDARQGEFIKSNFLINIANQVDRKYYTTASDKLKKDQIKFLTKCSDIVYCLNPDLMHVLPKKTKFLPYTIVDLDECKPIYLKNQSRKLRIGHAPSNRSVKGTDLIIKSLDILSAEGFQFEFILIENLTNREAKEIYKGIDILIDQLYAGWYGGLAVELMALGKPVMVYLREYDLKFIQKEIYTNIKYMSKRNNIYSHTKSSYT